MSTLKEIKIRFTNGLLGGTKSESYCLSPVNADKTRGTIFEIDGIGNILHQRVQEVGAIKSLGGFPRLGNLLHCAVIEQHLTGLVSNGACTLPREKESTILQPF